MTTELYKTCSMCNKTKVITNFYKVRVKYYQSKCKKCYNESRKRVKKRELTQEHIDYIKQHYHTMSTSELSKKMGFCGGWLRQKIRFDNIIPQSERKSSGRPRKIISVL